jgi:molybdopterin-guanine dinucleotide biosynthesis protein A
MSASRRRRQGPVGIVLAGGAGRRLGGDKAVVALDGRPLLDYPLQALRVAVGDVAVVAKRDTALPPLDAKVAVWLEPDEPRHPMAGVVRALRAAGGRAVLAVAVDLPFAGPGLLRRLATAPAGRALAVAPRAEGRLQPLCARYEPGALAALTGFDARERATDLLERLDPVVLDVDDADAFLNVNAAEDLLRASALLRVREP